MSDDVTSAPGAGPPRAGPARDGPPGDRTATAVDDDRVGGVPYRWVAMGVVLIGTFMVVLDTTVVNLGLPALQRDFDTLVGIEWVVTAYLAAVGVAQTCAGWAADRFGRRAAFLFAIALFTFSSVLCAASVNLWMLVGARVLQGFGGGLLMPVAMAMIYELFEPEERGKALGTFGIAVMAAPAIGPVLGGGLVASAGWRWLFLINVPIGLVGFPVALRLLRDTGFREVRRFDRTGLALGGTGLALLMIGVSEAGRNSWTEPSVVVMLSTCVVLLGLFGRHVLRAESPLVDLRIFANRVFAIGMGTRGLMAVSQFSRLVYIPLLLGTVRGVSELQIGLVMLPSAAGMATMMPVGGRLADRVGARIPVSVGIALLAASFAGLAELTTTTPLWVVSGLLFAGGLGSGLSMMAPGIVAMNSVTARQVSQATGLSTVSRQVSAAVGTAVLASIFAATRPEGLPSNLSPAAAVSPYRTVFLVSIGLLACAFVAAQFLPGKEKARALQQERRDELDTLAAEAATSEEPQEPEERAPAPRARDLAPETT